MKLVAINRPGLMRTGFLVGDYQLICDILGDENVDSDDVDKVGASWGFEDSDTGRTAFIWSYQVSKTRCRRWSTYGDSTLLTELFPGRTVSGLIQAIALGFFK